mmetsp:Transcript_9199/g.13616  ORF Transcript_9199/g.13616 Transcript_9199/m.13616 type:complete len:824 (-) Transcript_9199:2620-5091(-)
MGGKNDYDDAIDEMSDEDENDNQMKNWKALEDKGDGVKRFLWENEKLNAKLNRKNPTQGEICLSSLKEDIGEFVSLEENKKTCYGNKPSGGYCTVKGSHFLKEGCFYFEVYIDKSNDNNPNSYSNVVQIDNPHIRLGWAHIDSKVDIPVGYDEKSYSYRDLNGNVFHKSIPKRYGKPFKTGDYIGCLIYIPTRTEPKPKPKRQVVREVKDGETFEFITETPSAEIANGSFIEFYHNGEAQGKAFENITRDIYTPAISIYMGARATINYEKFKYPPPKLYPGTDIIIHQFKDLKQAKLKIIKKPSKPKKKKVVPENITPQKPIEPLKPTPPIKTSVGPTKPVVQQEVKKEIIQPTVKPKIQTKPPPQNRTAKLTSKKDKMVDVKEDSSKMKIKKITTIKDDKMRDDTPSKTRPPIKKPNKPQESKKRIPVLNVPRRPSMQIIETPAATSVATPIKRKRPKSNNNHLENTTAPKKMKPNPSISPLQPPIESRKNPHVSPTNKTYIIPSIEKTKLLIEEKKKKKKVKAKQREVVKEMPSNIPPPPTEHKPELTTTPNIPPQKPSKSAEKEARRFQKPLNPVSPPIPPSTTATTTNIPPQSMGKQKKFNVAMNSKKTIPAATPSPKPAIGKPTPSPTAIPPMHHPVHAIPPQARYPNYYRYPPYGPPPSYPLPMPKRVEVTEIPSSATKIDPARAFKLMGIRPPPSSENEDTSPHEMVSAPPGPPPNYMHNQYMVYHMPVGRAPPPHPPQMVHKEPQESDVLDETIIPQRPPPPRPYPPSQPPIHGYPYRPPPHGQPIYYAPPSYVPRYIAQQPPPPPLKQPKEGQE